MKLFGGFEAVKFCEENIIFVTHNGYLYYLYNFKYKQWSKYQNAGNAHITVDKYPDVSRAELMDAMKGIFPQKATDFMRLCPSSQLCINEMLVLLKEDYMNYLSDSSIYSAVYAFLVESNICHKSFKELKKLFDSAIMTREDKERVLIRIKELCFAIVGRDIFKKEIGIVDGHDSSSYFWIQPVRVVDYSDVNELDNVAEMSSAEISIEENNVNQYLTPFLYKYFDDELEVNKQRSDANGFEWYLTHNFFTFDSIREILRDINDTIDALSTGRENEYTVKLREKRGMATYKLLYARDLTEEQIKLYNANRPKEDDTQVELIIDFYKRFIYRMEYMITVGKENGYDLISFMGP